MQAIQKARSFITGVAPLMSSAFACFAGALWSEFPWVAVGVLLLAFLLTRNPRPWLIAIPLLAIAVAGRSEFLERPVRESLATPGSRVVTGTVIVGRPIGNFGDERKGLLLENGRKTKVLVERAESYRTGELLEITGRFFVPAAERNPGVFSTLKQWRRERIEGGLAIATSKSTGLRWQAAPFRRAEELKEKLREAITRGLAEDSDGRAVIQAMVLGEKPPRDSPVSRAFRESGAMHVFAVSGLHVTIVGGLCWFVLMNLPVPRRVGIFFVMLAMVTYSFVTGLNPPAVRATVMGISLLAAFFVRRRPSLFNALSLSFILVVVWDPSQIYQVGFQLSYGVLLAIGLGVKTAYRLTGKIATIDPFFPNRLLSDWQRRRLAVRRFFACLGASSLAAWLGSLPLMSWHFGMVTPIAVLTSLLLIPLTMFILGAAFFAAIVGLLSPTAGEWANLVNEKAAILAYRSAEGFSKVPFGHWQSRRLVAADWIVFDPGDGGGANFLDAGDGVMIDVGSRRFYHESLRSVLSTWHLDPSVVVLSHPDGGHGGALPLLLERGGLARAILPVEKALSPSYREFLAEAEVAGCDSSFGKTGERIPITEDISLEIVRAGQAPERGIADNRIMVVRVHWKGWRILVTSDLGIDDELALLESGADLAADVVVMGRHEWGVSGQLQFLRATGAKVVICSSAQYPPFEAPKPAWIAMVEKAGFALFNQGDTGAVLMDFSNHSLVVKSFLDPTKTTTLQR